MITRKKREAIATTRLNLYIEEELNREGKYIEKEVCNKIDTIMKKGKQMYLNHQKKGETGKKRTDEDVLEAAELAWPNFKTFYARFKSHPSLGPGAVEDSTYVAPPLNNEIELFAENEENSVPSDNLNVPSRTFEESFGDTDEENTQQPAVDEPSPAKQSKTNKSLTVSRIKKKSNASSMQFLTAIAEIQEKSQIRQMEHDRKMQSEAMEFQVRIEQDRLRFEAELSSSLQHQNNQFQASLMQCNQTFLAELLKKLFERRET